MTTAACSTPSLTRLTTRTRTATYLVRTPYSYCFRYAVPSDLQDIVGRRELRYSLRTGYLGQAKIKSRFLAVKVHNLFKELRERKASGMPVELTENQIKAIMAEWIQESLIEFLT